MASRLPSSTLRPAKNHEDCVAKPLGNIHIVCGEDHGGAGLSHLKDRLPQDLHVDRVQPAEGFVQDQQLRLRDDGGDELNLLRHAFRQSVNPLVSPAGRIEPVQPIVDGLTTSVAALQAGVVVQQTADVHAAVEPAFLRQITDPIIGRLSRPLSQHGYGAGIGLKNAKDHPQGRCLARSVRTNKAINAAGRDQQIQGVNGHLLAEPLCHLLKFNGVIHGVAMTGSRQDGRYVLELDDGDRFGTTDIRNRIRLRSSTVVPATSDKGDDFTPPSNATPPAPRGRSLEAPGENSG